MTLAYSEDLRQRALARSDAGQTDRAIDTVLSISPSYLSKWHELRRETGALKPGKQFLAPTLLPGDIVILDRLTQKQARASGHPCARRASDLPASLQPRSQSDQTTLFKDQTLVLKNAIMRQLGVMSATS